MSAFAIPTPNAFLGRRRPKPAAAPAGADPSRSGPAPLPPGIEALSYEQLHLYYKGLRCFVWTNPDDGEAQALLESVTERVRDRAKEDKARVGADLHQKPDLSPVTAEDGDSGCEKLLPHMSQLDIRSFQDPAALVKTLSVEKPIPLCSPDPSNATPEGEIACTIGDEYYAQGVPSATRSAKDSAALSTLLLGGAQFGIAKGFAKANSSKFKDHVAAVDALSFRDNGDAMLGALGMLLGKDLAGIPVEEQRKLLKRDLPRLIGLGLGGLTLYWLIQKRLQERKIDQRLEAGESVQAGKPEEFNPLPATNAFINAPLSLAGSLVGKPAKADSRNPLSLSTGVPVAAGFPATGSLLPTGSVPSGYAFNLLGDSEGILRGGEGHAMFNVARMVKSTDADVSASIWGSGKHLQLPPRLLETGAVGRTDGGAGVHLGAGGFHLGLGYHRSTTQGGANVDLWQAGVGYAATNDDQRVRTIKLRATYAEINVNENGSGDSVTEQLTGYSGVLKVGGMAELKLPLKNGTSLRLVGVTDVSVAQTEDGFARPELATVGGLVGFSHEGLSAGSYHVEMGIERGRFQPGIAGSPTMLRGMFRLSVMPAAMKNARVRGFGLGVAAQTVEDNRLQAPYASQIEGRTPFGNSALTFNLEIYIEPRTAAEREAAEQRRDEKRKSLDVRSQ